MIAWIAVAWLTLDIALIFAWSALRRWERQRWIDHWNAIRGDNEPLTPYPTDTDTEWMNQ